MFTGIPAMDNGRPVTLTAYLQWTGDYYGNFFRVIDTIQLRRNPTNTGWYGETNHILKYVQIIVWDTPATDTVDLELKLYDGVNFIDNHNWPTTPSSFRPPWGTDLLQTINPPMKAKIEIQILA